MLILTLVPPFHNNITKLLHHDISALIQSINQSAFMNGCRCITGAFVVDYKTSRVEALQELIGRYTYTPVLLCHPPSYCHSLYVVTFSSIQSLSRPIVTPSHLRLPFLSLPPPSSYYFPCRGYPRCYPARQRLGPKHVVVDTRAS